jgi:hypothetical protein
VPSDAQRWRLAARSPLPFGPKADASRHSLPNRFVVHAGVAHDEPAIVRWFLHSLGRTETLRLTSIRALKKLGAGDTALRRPRAA